MSPSPSDEIPDDPTVPQLAEAFGWTYRPEGVVIVLYNAREQIGSPAGRRDLYARALSLAEGNFS